MTEPFSAAAPTPYLVDPADVNAEGFLEVRVDYGQTADLSRMGIIMQDPGVVLVIPPRPANASTTALLVVRGVTCDGDLNGDGVVSAVDFVEVILAWGRADSPADLDGSGLVDVADLVAVILVWGDCV